MTYRNSSGFTLVELTLSMSFVAVLLLSITVLIMQITAIYNKGFTIREVNEAGQFISSELQRTLNQTSRDKVVFAQFPSHEGARLCTGGFVYAWNYRETLNDDKVAINQRHIPGDVSSITNDVRFMKFYGTKDYCEKDEEDNWMSIPTGAVELLSAGNSNIALASFDLRPPTWPDDDTSQAIYIIDMVIGTTDVGLIEGNNCKRDDQLSDDYCAINQFSFSARSGNKEDRGGDSL